MSNSRALLTGPLKDQPIKIRRHRAWNRALGRLRDAHYAEFLDLYNQELRKVEIT